jgi:hypothetical protein
MCTYRVIDKSFNGPRSSAQIASTVNDLPPSSVVTRSRTWREHYLKGLGQPIRARATSRGVLHSRLPNPPKGGLGDPAVCCFRLGGLTSRPHLYLDL